MNAVTKRARVSNKLSHDNVIMTTIYNVCFDDLCQMPLCEMSHDESDGVQRIQWSLDVALILVDCFGSGMIVYDIFHE